MYAKNFEYDGQLLSEYNCMVCNFDGSSGADYRTAGASITFNKVSRNFGRLHSVVGIKYDECITATFDICKDPDLAIGDNLYFTSDECRDLMRWLNQGQFHQFCVKHDNDDIDVFYFNASFNVEKIRVGEKVCGLRLKMDTDSPYAYGMTERFSFSVTSPTQDCKVKDVSDDIGDTSLTVSILCNASGDLTITNTTTGLSTLVRNCSLGETITIDGNSLMLSTSQSRNIWDDFNYVFPQITNSINNRINILHFSLPCEAVISYRPIIKEMF